MTEAELRHAVGDRVYGAFAPPGRLYNHDAEDPDGDGVPRHDRQGRGGRDQQAGRRVRPARLREHQPRRHGRRPQVGRHGPARRTAACATTTTSRRCGRAARSWTVTAASCTRRTGAWAGHRGRAASKVFQIETTLNTDTFPKPFDFLQKREWEWIAQRSRHVHRRRSRLERTPSQDARSIFQSLEAPARA